MKANGISGKSEIPLHQNEEEADHLKKIFDGIVCGLECHLQHSYDPDLKQRAWQQIYPTWSQAPELLEKITKAHKEGTVKQAAQTIGAQMSQDVLNVLAEMS